MIADFAILRGVIATVAQLAEHTLRKREVMGSSPFSGSIKARLDGLLFCVGLEFV